MSAAGSNPAPSAHQIPARGNAVEVDFLTDGRSDTRSDASLTRSERLDRLPFSREHRRLVLGSGAGWALDAMDVGLISFVMAALAVQWDLGPTTCRGSRRSASSGWRSAPASAVSSPTGSAGGRSSRSPSSSTASPPEPLRCRGRSRSLLVFRFLVGLGLGAELPVASTLVSEFAPARIRGRVVVALESFWAVGWVLAALIGYFVIPRPTTAGGGRSRSERFPPSTPSWSARAARVGALPGAARPASTRRRPPYAVSRSPPASSRLPGPRPPRPPAARPSPTATRPASALEPRSPPEHRPASGRCGSA